MRPTSTIVLLAILAGCAGAAAFFVLELVTPTEVREPIDG